MGEESEREGEKRFQKKKSMGQTAMSAWRGAACNTLGGEEESSVGYPLFWRGGGGGGTGESGGSPTLPREREKEAGGNSCPHLHYPLDVDSS